MILSENVLKSEEENDDSKENFGEEELNINQTIKGYLSEYEKSSDNDPKFNIIDNINKDPKFGGK